MGEISGKDAGTFAVLAAAAGAVRAVVDRPDTDTLRSSRPLLAADAAEYGFLIGAGGVDPARLAHAIEQARNSGAPAHRILLDEGSLTGERYLALLQGEIERLCSGPLAIGTRALDGLTASPSEVIAAARQARAEGDAPLLMSRAEIDRNEPEEVRLARAEAAADGLLRRSPAMSAGRRFATWQLVLAPASIGLAIGGLAVVPDATVVLLVSLMTLPFLLIVGLRVLALVVAARLPARTRTPVRLADAALPVYSILVPLFREAEVLPGLVAALQRLDYPAGKLEILLILESVDAETQAAVRALSLPDQFRVLVVPERPPRTKPKALNYALELARGDYVVVYDAEDEPEPDQLRRALAEFRRRPRQLMCVQARLAIDNHAPGFLVRQFMLEYAALFDAMLPALARLGLPLPLGGTSNHFPRAVLERLGGWDAYNVTEDADLGIRIARLGGHVQVLSSTTYEEAPEHLGVWMRQRTRWLKGFMLTWLVHMRSPRRLLAELGPASFTAFNALLGGIVLSSLIYPLFIGYLAFELATGQFMAQPGSTTESLILMLALFNLAGGYASGMAMAVLAARRRRLWSLLPRVLLMPLYWLLISAAAYRAALQLVSDPYLWEKTPHVARNRARPARY